MPETAGTMLRRMDKLGRVPNRHGRSSGAHDKGSVGKHTLVESSHHDQVKHDHGRDNRPAPRPRTSGDKVPEKPRAIDQLFSPPKEQDTSKKRSHPESSQEKQRGHEKDPHERKKQKDEGEKRKGEGEKEEKRGEEGKREETGGYEGEEEEEEEVAADEEEEEFDGDIVHLDGEITLAGVKMQWAKNAQVMKPDGCDYPHLTFNEGRAFTHVHFSSAEYNPAANTVNVIRSGFAWNGIKGKLVEDPLFKLGKQDLNPTSVTETVVIFDLSGGRRNQRISRTSKHVPPPTLQELAAALRLRC
jgi:hypothetical protein